jgi:hypothetical protein
MTQSAYPLVNSPILNASQWSKMASNWLGSGVIKGALNSLLVYADSTGMQVKVKSGQAFIRGHFFESDSEVTLPIGVSDPSLARIDRVIVRVDWTANSLQLAVLQGVASTVPSVPALTQNTSRWEIPLAQINLIANVSSISADSVTDDRFIVKNANFQQENWVAPVFQNAWINYGNNYETAGYLKDELGFVTLKGMIYNGLLTKAAFILPAGYRPAEIVRFSAQAHDGTNVVHASVEIKPTGNVDVMFGGNTWVLLNGLRFQAEQ